MEAVTLLPAPVGALPKLTRYRPRSHAPMLKPPKSEPESVGGPRRLARKFDIEALQIEKAVLYPSLSVRDYLLRVKGYTPKQYSVFIRWAAIPEWEARREQLQNEITANLLKRHVDAAAAAQDLFINTTRLGLTRVLEMLTKLQVQVVPEYAHVPDPDDPKKTKVVRKFGLRSADLANCMLALRTAQEIYRKAMGLTDESDSVAAVIRQMAELLGTGGVTVNQQTNLFLGASRLPPEAQERMAKFNYEEVLMLIESKREQRVKEGVLPIPLGDVIIHEGAAEDE